MASDVPGNRWGVFSSSRWQRFNIYAGLIFCASVFAFIYGGSTTSYIWVLAPLLGLIGFILTLFARTWGWVVVFALLILTLPMVIALQGI